MTLNHKLIPGAAMLSIVFSCKVTKLQEPSIEELNSRSFAKISLQELFENREKYQGQIVETQGYFRFGFEESAIYLDTSFGINSFKPSLKDSSRLFGDACGIWLDFHANHLFHRDYPPDSLRQRFVTVRGVFDTIQLGHVGGCYRASLTNTFSLKIVKPGN